MAAKLLPLMAVADHSEALVPRAEVPYWRLILVQSFAVQGSGATLAM